jgi:hypothetical protein
MVPIVAALLLILLLAASVTVADALRASHWRVVAVERRQAWRERTQVGG